MSFLSLLHYPTLQIHHTQKSAIPHQPFQNRTIPRPAPPHLPYERSVGFASLRNSGRSTSGIHARPLLKGGAVARKNSGDYRRDCLTTIPRLHQPFQNRTIPFAFRRASVCVCLYGFVFALSLSLFVGEGLVSRVTWFTLCASTWFTCYQ